MDKFKFHTKAIVAFLIGNLLAGCSSEDEMTHDSLYFPRKAIELSGKNQTTANDLCDFYLNFTTDVAKHIDNSKNKGDNIIISPLSIAMTFAMTANGVDSDTRNAYTDYLGTNDIESLNQLCATLLSRLPTADNYSTLGIANSMWVNKDMNLLLTQDYETTVKEKFLAEILYESFENNNANTLLTLNNWCSKNTGGNVSSHFNSLDGDIKTIIMNALYFKSVWAYTNFFNPKDTDTDTFHGSKGDSQIDMMKSYPYEGDYANDGELACFFIPFGNYAFQLEIVMPATDMPFEEIAKKLTPERMRSLHENLKETEITVYMPKFSLKNSYELNDILTPEMNQALTQNIGLTMFSPITTGNIQYKQSVSLSIDEKGAVASTVTSSNDYYTAIITDGDKVTAKLDSPFFFFIKEFSTGACILSGRIANI